jgi:hypothetical protein
LTRIAARSILGFRNRKKLHRPSPSLTLQRDFSTAWPDTFIILHRAKTSFPVPSGAKSGANFPDTHSVAPGHLARPDAITTDGAAKQQRTAESIRSFFMSLSRWIYPLGDGGKGVARLMGLEAWG